MTDTATFRGDPVSSRTGYCKVCDSSLAPEINRRLAVNLSAPKVIAYAKGRGLSLSKPTVLKHKAHITDPRVTLVRQAQRDPAIRNVTDDEFLDAIRDAAAANAASAPELVSVAEGIRAVQARPQRQPNHDILMVIARLVTDRVDVIEGVYRNEAPDLIEGEYHELPGDSAA